MPGRGMMRGCGWHGEFKSCGYRLTVPRKLIMDILGKTTKHLSAEDIFMEVHKLNPQIGLTTVYRTLDILAQMGMVSKFDFGDGRARYELKTSGEKSHHHHLVCTECKKVINYNDFMDEELECMGKTEKALSRKYNFDIKSHVVQFYGLCEKCRGEK
ncbi:MAG TPA: transcriptional repressor [Candidatus Omnitrophota bacterium]|nr:transcriptional repressor [Candidatus Omnitrophota bacterium]